MQIWANCDGCFQRVAVELAATPDAPCPDCGHSVNLPNGHDVFVSYATPDIEVAHQVCTALHARKLNYWFAPENIEPGDFFATAITEDLKKSKVVVIVLSEKAAHSRWVTAEAFKAFSLDMPILPFKIEQFDLPGEWDFMLGVIQWQE